MKMLHDQKIPYNMWKDPTIHFKVESRPVSIVLNIFTNCSKSYCYAACFHFVYRKSSVTIRSWEWLIINNKKYWK